MTSPTTKTIAKTVENMINEIGLLRQIVSIDSMPYELQEVRHLLRKLDAKLAEDQQR